MEYTEWAVASSLDKMVLAYGSIMLLYCSTFKRDPKDETIAINACIVTPANIAGLYDRINQLPILKNWVNSWALEGTAA